MSRCQTRLLFAANHLWNQWFQRHTRLEAGLRQPNWIPYERNLRERARGLRTAVATELQRLSTRLEAGGRALELLSPEHLMKRGYSIVRRPEGGVVTEAEGLQAGDPLRVTFYRGEASVVVEKKGRLSAPGQRIRSLSLSVQVWTPDGAGSCELTIAVRPSSRSRPMSALMRSPVSASRCVVGSSSR